METKNKYPIFLFDLDGTITREEILPIIAKEAGLYQEIETLTDATIKGLIPFESSFKLRCRLLNEVTVQTVKLALNKIKLFDTLVEFIKSNSLQCFIITGNLDIWISDLVKDICPCFSSTATIKNNDTLDSVTHIMRKGEQVKQLREKYPNFNFIAIGDGMGDVAMFQESDISIAFGGTHKPIESLIKTSDYVVSDESALVNLLKTML